MDWRGGGGRVGRRAGGVSGDVRATGACGRVGVWACPRYLKHLGGRFRTRPGSWRGETDLAVEQGSSPGVGVDYEHSRVLCAGLGTSASEAFRAEVAKVRAATCIPTLRDK